MNYVHEPKRDRKLLLHRKELTPEEEDQDVGMAVVPTRLFFAPNGICKLEIALAKGKKHSTTRA